MELHTVRSNSEVINFYTTSHMPGPCQGPDRKQIVCSTERKGQSQKCTYYVENKEVRVMTECR